MVVHLCLFTMAFSSVKDFHALKRAQLYLSYIFTSVIWRLDHLIKRDNCHIMLRVSQKRTSKYKRDEIRLFEVINF